MKTNRKHGFTVVELVVVIAIIAVLAAVLIPTFLSVIKRANISKDTQLIRNLNTSLVVDSAKNGKHTTMQSALDAAEQFGYDVAKINASATDNEILWDSKNDVFCYFNADSADTNKIEYIPEFPGTEGADPVDYFIISKDIDENYSTYYTGTAATITTDKGFDAGKSSVASITYDRSSATEGQTVVIRTNGGILTVNAPADTVKHYDEAAVLKIETVDTENCYREFGTVANAQIKKGKIVIESAEAKIEHLLLIAKESKSGFEEIVVEIKAGAELPVFDRTDVNIAENGTLVLNLVTPSANEYIYLTKAGVIEQIVVTTEKVDTTTIDVTTVASAKPASQTSETTYTAAQQVANVGKKNDDGKYVDSNGGVVELDNLTNVSQVATEAKADETAVQTGLTQFSGGVGTEKSPFLIASEKDWETLALGSITVDSLYGAKGYSYKVVNDLDMSYLKSKDDQFKFRLQYFHGTIDFDKHKMTWMTPYEPAYSCLITNSYYGCTIKNANFYLSNRGTIISNSSNEDHKLIDQHIVLKDINIYGNIEADTTNWYTPFYSWWMSEDSKLTMENCNNYCNITSSAGNTGIFVGRTYGFTDSYDICFYDIELINCNNYGSLINTNGSAGMLFANAGPYFDASKVKVEKCGNYGTIIGKKNTNLICGNLDEKYYVKTNANYNPNNNVEGLDVSNKQIGVCGKAEISTLNVENGNFVLPQTANAAYYVLSFVTTYNEGGGATTGIAYRLTEEQRVALNLKAYEFSVGAGSNLTTGATAITVGDGTLYVKDEKYLFINWTTSESDKSDLHYINRQPTVSFIAFDENGKMLAAYNYTYSN